MIRRGSPWGYYSDWAPKSLAWHPFRGGGELCGSRAEQLRLGSLETTAFGQHAYITSALHPLTAGVCESWSNDNNLSQGLKQVTNFFLQWATDSLKRQTLSWHILIRTASERRGCSGAAGCCVGLVANNEKHLQGQILLLLSRSLRKGAVETRRAAQTSSIPLSFAFCLQALRSLWRSIWAVSNRELGSDARRERSRRWAFVIETER